MMDATKEGAGRESTVWNALDRGPILFISLMLVIPLLPSASAANFDLVAKSVGYQKTALPWPFVGQFSYVVDLEVCSSPNGQNDDFWAWYLVYNADDPEVAGFQVEAIETQDFQACPGSNTVSRIVVAHTANNYCCAWAMVDSKRLIDETDESNNHKSHNPGRLAILAGQSAQGRLAVFNTGTETETFSSSYSGLPSGWALSWVTGSVEGDPGEQGFMEYELTAPGSVTNWPTLVFCS